MELKDWILLLHPTIAVIIIFPAMGVALNLALQTRQRRLEIAKAGKSKIPAVGAAHVRFGQLLTGSVVAVVLIALAHGIFSHIAEKQIWNKNSWQVLSICLWFAATIASLVFLYRAKTRLWRGVFATLTGMGLIVLGSQDGVYRKTDYWYISHYYYGIAAACLAIFSLAILRDIYQDKSNRWRKTHIVVSSLMLLLFIGQAVTGTISLLEIPLSWQKPYVQKLYQEKCTQNPCLIKAAPNSISK